MKKIVLLLLLLLVFGVASASAANYNVRLKCYSSLAKSMPKIINKVFKYSFRDTPGVKGRVKFKRLNRETTTFDASEFPEAVPGVIYAISLPPSCVYQVQPTYKFKIPGVGNVIVEGSPLNLPGDFQ